MLANKLISKLKSKNKINKVRVSTNQVKAQYSTSESEKIDFLVRNYKILHEALSTSPEKAAQFANNIPSSENKKVADFLDRVSALAHKEKLFGEGAEAKELLRQINLYKQAAKGSTAGKTPVKVAVTGASGQIGYALLFRIASGAMFGRNTPVQLNLLELPVAMNSLKGVIMELQDCAFPLLSKVEAFDDPNKAFVDIDYALLVGAKPRTKGMERADLLLGNAEIFSVQGKALNTVAKKTCKVAVVGNPANTNAMIAQRNAPSIPAENFTAMTRLDHNRGLAQLSLKTGAHVSDIENFAICGNHSATQYPSIAHAFINGKPAAEVINDNNWVVNTFIPEVQQRGAAIIAARGASSAASAASSLIDHVHDWIHGSNGEWTSMGVISKGEYGVSEGLNYSYPVVTAAGEYSVVENLPIDSFSAERMEKTHQELKGERDAIAKLLPK